MSAIVFDLVADQDRDFSISFIWYDEFGQRVGLTGKGARAEVRTTEGQSLGQVSEANAIILHTPNNLDDPDYGRIDFGYPRYFLTSPASLDCVYEFVILNNASDVTDGVYSVLRGRFTIRPQVALIPES